MKTIAKSVALAVLIASLGSNAMADGRWGQNHGYYGHGHGSDWVAPLLFLGLAGAVIGAASQSSPPPQPVYVSQPVYVQPPVTYVQAAPAPVYAAPEVATPAPAPVNAWYFCRSVGQYYPYTQHCPEGWQLVTPPQR